MKRALAERAKQQNDHPTGPRRSGSSQESYLLPPTTHQTHRENSKAAMTPSKSSLPASQPQNSRDHSFRTSSPLSSQWSPCPSSPRSRSHTHSGNGKGAYLNTPSSPQSTELSSLKPHKRRRSSPSVSTVTTTHHLEVLPSDEGDSSASECNPESIKNGFYLRHQNRALASELYSYKRCIAQLERERRERRRRCTEIGRVIGEMGVRWTEGELGIVTCLRALGKSHSETSRFVNSEFERFHPSMGVASTGTGMDVETAESIMDSMNTLAHSSVIVPLPNPSGGYTNTNTNRKIQEKTNPETAEWSSISRTVVAFSNRVTNFHTLFVQLLVTLIPSYPVGSSNSKDPVTQPTIQHEEFFHAVELHKEIFSLKGTCAELDTKLGELAKARDEANDSERRVRRVLYRVASGRMKISEVLHAVEKVGSSSLKDPADLQDNFITSSGDIFYAAESKSLVSNHTIGEGSGKSDNHDSESLTMILDGIRYDINDVRLLKRKISQLEELCKVRETEIAELLRTQEEREKKVNYLLGSHRATNYKSTMTQENVKGSSLYVELVLKLTAAERQSRGYQEKLRSVTQSWAVANGDLNLARKSVEDLQEQHTKRMKELVVPNKEYLTNVKTMMELEHKLQHALATVRHSESIRISISEANSMNDALQSKLEELKSKNATLVAHKVAARAEISSSLNPTTRNVSSKDSGKVESSSHGMMLLKDKIHRMKKELAAAMVSKDQAKVKQERAENERDILMKTNTRLIKQSVEKDDMNAKSLSTILHLKHLSEQLEQEKDVLIKKLKGVEQLALSARLAANAKVRVSEEVQRGKMLAQDEVKEGLSKTEALQKEKEGLERRLDVSHARALAAEQDLSTMRERCDELVSLSTLIEEENKQLSESFVVAKAETLEARKKIVAVSVQNSGSLKEGDNCMFTAKQLTLQVEHLKSRLYCPVCNTRDKQVILVRCRHMFCRQCVDQNMKNRSRKCPACAHRFDMKDVRDVWL